MCMIVFMAIIGRVFMTLFVKLQISNLFSMVPNLYLNEPTCLKKKVENNSTSEGAFYQSE